ncbi:MAG: type III polyketide synthase [Planctomycetes bacterium]|nr:type III polyketide synthase [Planctomycetota bacterium]
MSFHIAGLGTAVPEHFAEQREAAELAASLSGETARQQMLLKTLYGLTGVKSRRSVLLESSSGSGPLRQSFYRDHVETPAGPTTAERMARYESDAGPLAVAACRAALANAGIAPGKVTHLVTASCSGFSAPGFDLELVHSLPLPATTSRTHIGFMGCHAVLNALRVAHAFTEADPRAVVLVCALELCTLHHQYDWRPDRIIANALFADGAAAVVGHRGRTPSNPQGQSSHQGRADRHGRADGHWQLIASGSIVLPASAEMMTWRIGDHGFEMSLSPEVPKLIHHHLRPWLAGWLAGQGLTLESVASWAVHPGGPKILRACAEAVGFDPAHLDDSQQVLSELGNMSSPTVLFILERLRRRNAPRPCVALAFGPGLTVEAALIG